MPTMAKNGPFTKAVNEQYFLCLFFSIKSFDFQPNITFFSYQMMIEAGLMDQPNIRYVIE